MRVMRWLLVGLMIVAGGREGFALLADETKASVAPGEPIAIPLGGLRAGALASVTVSVDSLAALGAEGRVEVSISDAQGVAVSKTLHGGDADLYITLRPRANGAGSVRLLSSGVTGSIPVSVLRADIGGDDVVTIAAQPNGDWKSAQPIELGKTVFGSGDDRPYIPKSVSAPDQAEALFDGAQWFTFDYAGPGPTLAFFDVDVLDRDVAMDVSLFTPKSENGAETLEPFTEGAERYFQEKSMAFHGLQKFIARTLKPGKYYVRVCANHPAYQLRTRLLPPPPYEDPRAAVRTAMDYLMKKGDAWHGNTPRRGGVALRTSNPLQETSLCIACHPTHFTTRAELIAIDNGYPLRERPALQFLTDRLYNNPRPIYGHPEAAWVRMISAPGNVMSRLAYMLFTFEREVSHEERQGILGPIANYLEMYWSKQDAIYDESNGNQPRVSGFEIALHNGLLFEELHRRSGEAKYAALREKMELIAAAGECKDNLDLCWKAVALSTFDKSKHADAIAKIVEELFSRQREDGTWALPFGELVYGHDYTKQKGTSTKAPLDAQGRPKSSEFQTYHCIYALAKAGVTMDDARLAKSVKWCLAHQQPFGGWQGNDDYKNFDTPFRDTQYAVMALSELFHGPGGKNAEAKTGWMADFFPSPATFNLADTPATLAALDRIWEDPGPETRELIRRAMSSPVPLVRAAAAQAAGRIADADAFPELAGRLGDPSKIVQRAAAWSVRQIVTRRPAVPLAARAELLASADDRTRWGAARVFNQHFRSLAPDWPAAERLMEMMESDPAPAIRMAAAQAMWKWWYWEGDLARKGEIEGRFIAAMAKPEHPWVRRNLIEGMHNILDENVRYFYNSWSRQLTADGAREEVEAGRRAVAKGQADRISKALAEGNDLQRDALLRSFYAFHLRESGGPAEATASVPTPPFAEGDWIDGFRKYAAYDPLTMGTGVMARIGNDHDPIDFYEDSGPVMREGLMAVLAQSSPPLALAALKALKQTSDIPFDDALSSRLVALSLGSGAAEDKEIRAFLTELLPASISRGDGVAAALAGVVEKGTPEALAVAESVIADKRNKPLAESGPFQAALKARIVAAPLDAPELPSLASMLAYAEPLQSDRAVVDKTFDALMLGPSPARRAAANAMIRGGRFLVAGPSRERFQAELNAAEAGPLADALEAVSKIDYKKLGSESSQSLALGVVTTALARPEPELRRAALDAVRAVVAFQSNPAVAARVGELASDGDAKVRESAASLLDSLKVRGKKASEQDVAALLDYGYFKRVINPILQAKGADSEACAQCHMNHTILKLNAGEALAEAELRENYLSALKVVDLNDPENSLILVKPRMPFDGIELPGNYRKTHGGNVRWKSGKETDDYQAILKWIQGAKAETETAQK